MPTEFLSGRVILHPGDCREVLKTLPDNSIDSPLFASVETMEAAE